MEWMEWRAQKREPTSRCLAQYLHDGRPQGRQYRASTCVNRRQSRYRQRQPEVSVALQVHNVHSRWIPESRIQNVTYQVDTCTVSWPLSASVAETPGFPRIPLSQASVKETFFDSCVRASKRKHCHGWKLHPPKRAWYQLVVAPVWTARIPNNSAVLVRRYELAAKLCGAPIAALHRP